MLSHRTGRVNPGDLPRLSAAGWFGPFTGPFTGHSPGSTFGVYSRRSPARATNLHVCQPIGEEVREVKRQFPQWRPLGRVVALALVLAAIPLPCLAGEPDKSAPPPGLRASIARAATSGSTALAQVKPTAPDRAKLGSTSFFKSPAGIATIVVVALGTGYAVYSTRHDRIHSVIRQGQ